MKKRYPLQINILNLKNVQIQRKRAFYGYSNLHHSQIIDPTLEIKNLKHPMKPFEGARRKQIFKMTHERHKPNYRPCFFFSFLFVVTQGGKTISHDRLVFETLILRLSLEQLIRYARNCQDKINVCLAIELELIDLIGYHVELILNDQQNYSNFLKKYLTSFHKIHRIKYVHDHLFII